MDSDNTKIIAEITSYPQNDSLLMARWVGMYFTLNYLILQVSMESTKDE